MVTCPTPMKHAYRTKAIALMKAACNRRQNSPDLYAYRCKCRSWHLTRQAR